MTHPALAPYEVFPKTPKQVFAGVENDATVFLNFPDEQTARDALVEAGLAKDDGKGGVTFAQGVDYIGSGQRETAESRQSKDAAVKVHVGVLVNLIA